MNKEQYFIDQLNQLRQNDIQELMVSKEDFLTFRKVWLEQEDKNYFIGYAKRQGKVIYRYETSHDEND